MSVSRPTRRATGLGLVAAALTAPAHAQADGTYTVEEMTQAASNFFGAGAEGLASVMQRAFADNGRPVGYIEGTEASGAIGFGLRYGEGRQYFRRNPDGMRVFWQGPSVGFDSGGNASKVFTLIYGMTDPRQIFRRFPGVEGTAYFIGGVGLNYQRAEGITLAPMRFGVGLRAGANIGYLAYSPRRNILPF